MELPEGFVAIRDPRKPGDYLVLSKSDFNPSKHRLFESEPPAPEVEPEAETKNKPKRRG
jgi:hypothetical protein